MMEATMAGNMSATFAVVAQHPGSNGLNPHQHVGGGGGGRVTSRAISFAAVPPSVVAAPATANAPAPTAPAASLVSSTVTAAFCEPLAAGAADAAACAPTAAAPAIAVAAVATAADAAITATASLLCGCCCCCIIGEEFICCVCGVSICWRWGAAVVASDTAACAACALACCTFSLALVNMLTHTGLTAAPGSLEISRFTAIVGSLLPPR
mmetsp:Transcript_22001/g.71118  ORF Transcript_22001/g.71118 Transcript_22001/m.71118 type:complete len:210 (+) Transcript_22001:417-1046(+)